MKEFFQKFDQASTKIHEQKTYSTSLGKCLGLIAFLFLIVAFLYKFHSMMSKQQMYLNTYYANDRSAISISDFEFRLMISTWSSIPITFKNQFQYGLNVTIVEYIQTPDNLEKIIIDKNYEPLNQSMRNIRQKLLQKRNQNSFKFDYRRIQLIPCQINPEQFCVPQEFLHNMTLQGDTYFQDDKVVYYQIQVLPCDKNEQQNCKSPSKSGYLSIFKFLCRRFNVYEKQTEQMFSQCKIPTGSMNYIADSANILERVSYKIKQVNITTIQPKIFPSIVPKFLFPESQNKKFQQFWYFDDESTQGQSNRTTGRQPFLVIKFERSRRSESYQRNFIGIDSVLGEIFGISAFVTIVLKVILDGFTKWQAQCYLASETSEDRKFKGSFIKYLKQKILCCCSRKKYNEQAQKRKEAVKEAYQHVDVVEANRKFKQLEQRMTQLQNMLSQSKKLKSVEQFTEEKNIQKQIKLATKYLNPNNEERQSKLNDSIEGSIEEPLLDS